MKMKLIFINKMKNNKLNKMKMLMLLMLLFSTLLTINSSTWFNAWMGLELNLMSFIPLMMNNSKKKNSNSMMMYFIVQASTSSMMMMMIIMTKLEMIQMKMNITMMLIQSSILMKMGAAPFHWWMPKIILNLNWMNCFLFFTWQKIAPLFLIMMLNNNMLIYFMAMMSNILGAIMGINQNSLKLIMMYSSINNIGWMLMNLIMNKNILLIYFTVYSFTIWLICVMLNNTKTKFINQLYKQNNQNNIMKLIITSTMFLSLSGLPPFIGFLPKLLTLNLMIKNLMYFESFLFTINAIITLSFYMKPLLSALILNKNNFKWMNKNYMTKYFMFNFLMINMSIIFILMMNSIYNIL
uniref:NADH-ubiquinone oxidoreductase chain 2 n=1 Tax=Sinopoppia nigroflagella TaxID=2803872 RepID=A0A897G088_9HYME|nr:NADH dehydrogenase subunit 2 [Sinopoppia nigroflagella]QSF20064.1 NADH dehydrogenase subunit 2 [Sinopoppia nigroflagella]